MSYEENSKVRAKEHKVEMLGRASLAVTGVEDVESFDEAEIVMNTSQGNLIVRGSGLHIGKISLDVGEMRVEGLISELMYEEQSSVQGGFWSKLFG